MAKKTNKPRLDCTLSTKEAIKWLKNGYIIHLNCYDYFYKYDEVNNSTLYLAPGDLSWGLYSTGCELMEDQFFTIVSKQNLMSQAKRIAKQQKQNIQYKYLKFLQDIK